MKLKSLLLSATLFCFTASTLVQAQLSFNGNIVSKWKFDETTGTAISDDLTDATGEVMHGDGLQWLAGKSGNSIDLTASLDTSIIIIEETEQLKAINFSNTSFSVSVWVKYDPSLGEQTIICKGANNATDAPNSNGHRYIIQSKNGELRFAIDDDVTKTQLGVTPDSYPLNEWVHLVGMRNVEDGMLYLYMNGEMLDLGEIDGTGDLDIENQRLIIGNYQNKANKVIGGIDETLIINKALSAAEVLELYTSYDTSNGFVNTKLSGAKISTSKGAIEVTVESQSEITINTLGGQIVTSGIIDGTTTFTFQSGIYIVKINGVANKVMVK